MRTESHIIVRYQETDQMGIVYHANYLTWFEIGRTDWVAQAGFPYARIEAQGLLLPVIDAVLHYRYPARYGDEVVVITTVTEAARTKMTFSYEVLRLPERELLVTGSTSHGWVDTQMQPVRVKHFYPELAAMLDRLIEELKGKERDV